VARVASILAPISPVLTEVAAIFEEIPAILPAVAPASLVSRVAHVFAGIATIFAPIAVVFTSIEAILDAIAPLVSRGFRQRRGRGQERDEQCRNNDLREPGHRCLSLGQALRVRRESPQAGCFLHSEF